MTKITKLTAAQEARLIEFREEWLQVGLCCDPADFATGDEVIRGFYARLGKPSPIILHFSSPAMCELAVNFVFALLASRPGQLRSQLDSQLRSQLGSQLDSQLRSQLGSQLGSQLRSQLDSQIDSQLGSQLDSQLRSQLYSQLRSQLRSQLDSQLYSQLYSQLGSQLGSQLYIQLRSQLYSQLGSQLRSQLDSQIDSQLRSQLDSQLDSQLRSQLDSQLDSQLGSQLRSLKAYFLNNRWGAGHWCSWEAFYLFGHEIGVSYKAEDIALLLEWGRLSKSIGWWAPWNGICFVSDRPRVVKFDEERRLHSETGKAVEYSDGWGVTCWHGTRVPDEWLADKSSLTPKAALTSSNIEQRRAGCEILGWEKILSELGARSIDKDGDPQIGELVEVDLPGEDNETIRARYLRVQCGTGRKFAVCVPPNTETALDAQSWMLGLPTEQFTRPEVRT